MACFHNDYLNALDNTTTELFWVSTNNISVDHDYINNFYIDWHNRVDREQTHVFLHKVNSELYKNGLILCSTCKALTEKEVEYRHPVERLFVKLTTIPIFVIIFIPTTNITTQFI